MAVVFDANILLLALDPSAKPPIDPATKRELEHAQQRVTYLIKVLSKARTTVIIPAPVFCEVLVGAGAAEEGYIAELRKFPFRVAPFDMRAAIECARAIGPNGLRSTSPANPRAKIKFDRQIVAIAKVEQVEAIYSDDQHIHTLAKRAGVKVLCTFDLELDPEDQQLSLVLDAEDEVPPTRGQKLSANLQRRRQLANKPD